MTTLLFVLLLALAALDDTTQIKIGSVCVMLPNIALKVFMFVTCTCSKEDIQCVLAGLMFVSKARSLP
jgi:hypothetical protein